MIQLGSKGGVNSFIECHGGTDQANQKVRPCGPLQFGFQKAAADWFGLANVGTRNRSGRAIFDRC